MDGAKLNVVNEDGQIIGEEMRETIHREGLLHREVHVWFYTPNDEIILQQRAEDKDTYPGLLDATAGGHVEIGLDFEAAAIQETKEETGIEVQLHDLIFMNKYRGKSYDKTTGMTNNVIRNVYAYKYQGSVSDLTVEEGKAEGFELWPLEKIFDISEKDSERFIPTVLKEETLETFRQMRTRLG